MYRRSIEKKLKKISSQYRCVTLIGPRQSGKTTLSKMFFPKLEYYSFETPEVNEQFLFDPKGFLQRIGKGAIFDEVQKCPTLLSYLQEILDDPRDTRKFVLTGSNNLKLSHKVSQSLAGRTRILTILPFERKEIPLKKQKKDLESALLWGAYPRLYHQRLDFASWYGDYINTYVEKDIRDTVNITDLTSFNNFLRLLAGRVGQIVNYNSLAGDVGHSQPTIKRWISALETTFICFTLPPHFNNFNKRIIKSPKIYFYDTGLVCNLLRIKTKQQLELHPLKGQIFENWVIAEVMKTFLNDGVEAPLYFWRDQHGHEVDLVIDRGTYLDLVEIKSGQTFHASFFDNIKWLNNIQPQTPYKDPNNKLKGHCIYGGERKIKLGDFAVSPWNKFQIKTS